MATAPTHATRLRERSRGAQGRRRAGSAWDRRAAQVLCAILAVIGVLPFATALLVRSAWARSWTARETQRLLREQKIAATYAPALRVWPLAIELDRLRVESTDNGPPALVSSRVMVRPRLFALLAGKLAIDQIDLDQPRVRAVVRGGELTNLALPKGGGGGGPIHVPFSVFSLTDASLDVDIEGTRVQAQSLDLDATAEDDPRRGSSFELALRVGQATVQRPRTGAEGADVVDDDVLCSLDVRVHVDPDAILIRRFEGAGVVDFDAAPGTTPTCDVPQTDKRRAAIAINHLRIELPRSDGASPAHALTIDGHVRARAPIELAERMAHLPETDGWVGVDADVRYGPDTLLPDVSGSIEAHDVRLDKYSFAHELLSEVTIRQNIVRSPKTTVRIANGLVTLSDTVVDPLGGGGRLVRTRLDAAGVDFTALMRDLGVHQHSWVGWEVREIHAPLLSGSFAPLKIDGDFTAKTYSFGIYDRPAEDKARQRIFGFSEAQLAAHLGVRPDSVKFMDVRATLPHSQVEGGLVSLGFDDVLRIEAPHVRADLDDISPIGPVTLHGKTEVSAQVGGVFNHPTPQGDILSASNLVVADVAFGDVTGGHVKVEIRPPQVEFTAVRAKRRGSTYEVPTARLDFAGGHGVVVDAEAVSDALAMRDMLSMFNLDEDPRFDGLDASLGLHAAVHVAAGSPEDACGGGYVAVNAKSHLRNVDVYGEHFAQGDADLSLRWFDRLRGLAGADVDVRSFVLDKVLPPSGRRAGATGTVLGSAMIRRGGALAANLSIDNVPLQRLDTLGSFASQVEGSLSGVAQVTGNLDDFLPDAGFVVRAALDAAGTRVRDVALPGSHLDVRMTNRMPRQLKAMGRTRCGGAIGPPFDKQAYLADESSHGEFTVNGDLFGHMISARDLVLTRARAPRLTGRVSVRGLDLGPMTRILTKTEGGENGGAERTAPALGGQLWGELLLDDVRLDALAQSRARLVLGPTVLSRGGQRLTLQPPGEPIALTDDVLKMPPLRVTLETPEGFRGGFEVSGSATSVTRNANLAFAARLEPVDLAILQRIVPKVDRASGRLTGSVRVSGRAAAPVIAGELHVTGEDLEVRGLPSAITDVVLDVTATGEGLKAAGTGKFGAGTVTFHGTAPIHGLDVGPLDSRIAVRSVRLAPADGVSAAVDADLALAYDPKAQGEQAATLPHVTGDVTLQTLSYTRPITFNLDLASARGRRTEVDAYDPSLDFVVFDVRMSARAPIIIKNNLAEVQLGIDSGALEVTGTNQRLGLRGVLRSLPGGRFHFQSNDFDVQQGVIRFDDPTRIDPNVDITAVTEYRRYTDTSAGAVTGGGGTTAASTGSTRGGALWRITMHAYGDADNVRIEMTSEPALAQQDIVLLLTVGMTRAELDQLQATGIGESVALNVLGAATGADRAVKKALPIIDDFRFGSAYSTSTGKTEPQLTVGKRLTNDLRASVTAGLSEDRELRSNIEWRLNNHLSLQGSYDNINDVSSSTLGNLGVDLRWRLDFE